MTAERDLQSDIAKLSELDTCLHAASPAVVLVEGTRQVPASVFPKLTEFAVRLARRYPNVRFRSGNATGADEAFAEGVARVDAARLECVVPYAGMRQKHLPPLTRRVALDELSAAALRSCAQVSHRASPRYQRIVDYYLEKPGKNRAVMQASYLLRDVLKVCGSEEPPLAPATAGIFYVNNAEPLSGGTGHTIRVCRVAKVPIVIQQDWINWFAA